MSVSSIPVMCYYNGHIVRTDNDVKYDGNKASIVPLEIPVDCTFEQLGDIVTPQNPGARWLPVNPRNTSGGRVTRRYFRKSGRVSFVREALAKNSTCIYLSQTVQYMQYISNMATWAHNSTQHTC